jgi:hypothetical protein
VMWMINVYLNLGRTPVNEGAGSHTHRHVVVR